MPKARLLLVWPGMAGLLLYATLAVCQYRAALAMSDFHELQRANPLNSQHPAALRVVQQKMSALRDAARMDHSDPEPLYEKALLDLGTAEADSLSSVESQRNLGEGPDTRLLGRLQDGARAIRGAIVKNPGMAEHHLIAALVFQNLIGDGIGDARVTGSQRVVSAHLEESGQLDPYRPSLHFRIGTFQMALGDRTAAKRSFDVAFADNYHYARPIFDVLWSSVGNVKELGQYIGDEPLSRALLGDFLWEHGYKEEAAKEYEFASSHGPIDFRTGELLVEQAFRTRDFPGARRIVSLLEQDRKAWTPSQLARLEYFRGQSFFQEDRYQEAINSFETALASDPDVYYIHEALGNSCAAVRDYDRAIARYLLVLSKTGNSLPPREAARLHVELASVYEKQSRYSDAFVHYLTAAKLDPNNGVAQRRAAEISRDNLR